MIAEYEECYEVEEGSPDNRLEWRQHFSTYDGSNRIGRIVKAIDVIENKRKADDYY